MAYVKHCCLLLLLSVLSATAIAQKVTLSGYMRDAETGESLISGTVYIKEAVQGTESNSYGFYSVSVPPGSYTVVFSYVGYAPIEQTMNLIENKTFNAELHSSSNLKEVNVTTGRKDDNVKNTDMGTVTLSIERIKTLPVLFGEVDILKTLQLLPGVQSAGEGNSGLYIRGGGPDQGGGRGLPLCHQFPVCHLPLAHRRRRCAELQVAAGCRPPNVTAASTTPSND